MANTFPHIRAAAIDQRAHTVFYRQTELENLYKTLTTNMNEVKEALVKDYGHSPGEVAIEVNLALAIIRREYASLQPDKAQEEEYLIAVGKDAPTSRRPVGIVYIEPCRHTLLYSVVAPLSAAIAAGNCVIILLENNLHILSSLLRKTLSDALSKDTFAVASRPVQQHSLPGATSIVYVNQNGGKDWPGANQITSSHLNRVVAIVDRTADVQQAARELVAARFSFRGRSPYAPDCVFVNEFVKQAFLQAVISECVGLSNDVLPKEIGKEKSAVTDFVRQKVDSLKELDPALRIILQDEKMAVVVTSVRTPEYLMGKVDTSVLIVHSVRSLDDAIDLIGSTATGPALAAYHFGNAATCKYLAQFVDASVTFVKNIPREILVGPAFPTAHPTTPTTRYAREMFSVPRPAYTAPWLSSVTLESALRMSSGAMIKQLLEEATLPLAVMKRSKGGGVGFFEQGFLMNAGLILTTVISVSGVGVYWSIRHRRP